MARKISSKVAAKETPVKEEQLRDYELVLVFNPELAEDGLEASLGKISQLITDKKGTLGTVEHWGKKKLAYPIKHYLEGSYVLARFQMSQLRANELEANLHISEDILRHLLTRMNS